MPRYVVPANWTDQGIKNGEHTTERMDHGGELAEKHGLKLEQAYWTVGPYDMLSIFEASEDEALSAYLLEIGSSGNVRTTTLRAYEEEEMSKILRRLGSAVSTSGNAVHAKFVEFTFRNCLENSRRRLTAPLWRQVAPESGLLRPLLAALGAQFRDLSRFSKQFLYEVG